MSFTSLINLRHCRVTRKTDVILEAIQITAAPVVNRQPPEAACLYIKISGCTDGTGQVTVNGIVAGAADSEIFSFSENRTVEGIKEFTSITSIATLGFIGEATVGNIEIKVATPTGQPIYQEVEIFSEMPCWVDMRRGGVTVVIPGGVITAVTKLFCKHDALHPLSENDIIYYNNQEYRIDFIEKVASRGKAIHHLELMLKKAKTE